MSGTAGSGGSARGLRRRRQKGRLGGLGMLASLPRFFLVCLCRLPPYHSSTFNHPFPSFSPRLSHPTTPHPIPPYPIPSRDSKSVPFPSRGLVCCCCWEGSQVERRQRDALGGGGSSRQAHWNALMRASAWFWRCGVVPGGVYVHAGGRVWARSCLGQPLSVCAWFVWCGSVGEPVSCRGLVSELAMGWFRLGGARASAAAAEAAKRRQCTTNFKQQQ